MANWPNGKALPLNGKAFRLYTRRQLNKADMTRGGHLQTYEDIYPTPTLTAPGSTS